jgi:hypothetical protein
MIEACQVKKILILIIVKLFSFTDKKIMFPCYQEKQPLNAMACYDTAYFFCSLIDFRRLAGPRSRRIQHFYF